MDPTLTSNSGTVDTVCTAMVEEDPIYVALNRRFGAVESCSHVQDREGGVDFGEIISVGWDGVNFIREQRPPESTIVNVRFAPSKPPSREWFVAHRDELVPLALGIDWTKNFSNDPHVEQYESTDQGFNGKVEIVSDTEGHLKSFRLSYAL